MEAKLFFSLVICFVSHINAVDQKHHEWPKNPHPAYLINHWKYPSEEHTVETSDGYRLGLFRIPADRHPRAHRTPVLIMHGFLSSSSYWVMNGPQESLGFLLANAGYDVWMGNIRANKYSRGHNTLNASSPEFWDFRQDDVILNDAPAMIDYILDKTFRDKIIYIGYSMSTRVILGLLAAKPEYNQKILKVVLMALVAFWTDSLTDRMELQPKVSEAILGYFSPTQSVFPDRETYESALSNGLCEKENNIICSFCAIDFDSDPHKDKDRMELYKNVYPSGSSSWVLLQFAQNKALQEFAFYDYGPEENLKKYGQESPKLYDLSKVVVPILIVSSSHDGFGSSAGIRKLTERLPSPPTMHVIPEDENFSHGDFAFSRAAARLVYTPVIKDLDNFLKMTAMVQKEMDLAREQ